MGHKRFDPYREGEEAFTPGEPINNPYPDEGYQHSGYYFKCGWVRAQQEYDEEIERTSRPRCPMCGAYMDQFSSGLYCEDTNGCKYHTHEEG